MATLQRTRELILDVPITLFVGENGSGKSTLLRAVTRRSGVHIWADPDEPETALSPRRQIELLHLLQEMAQAGHAQFLIATHSPILLSCPGAALFSFDQAPIRAMACEDTDHYRVYRDFMADPHGFAGGPQP